MKFLRALTAVGLGCLLFIGGTRPAQADPHAVFYTSIGQQQLFFNMLAALDQADYVEPAVNTLGTPSGQSRQELLENRQNTPFGSPLPDPRLSATKTQLSSVLTRNITLEGFDLWTAYQLQNRSNDFQKRAAIGELSRLMCQHALAIPFCDISEAANFAKRAYAIIIDHTTQELLPLERGVLATLLSGSPQDNAIRREILQKHKNDPFSWEYNPAIASAWQAASGDNQKMQLLNSLFTSTLGSFIPAQIDPSIYSRLNIEADGSVSTGARLGAAIPNGTVLAQNEEVLDNLDYTSRYVSNLFTILRNPAAATETALAAEENARNEQKSNESGYKAPKAYSSTAPVPGGAANAQTGTSPFGDTASAQAGGSALGRLGTSIIVPAQSRISASDSLKQAGVVSDNSITSAPAQGQFDPGDVNLINKPLNLSSALGNVQGIQDTNNGAAATPSSVPGTTINPAADGKVAGLFDLVGIGFEILLQYFYDYFNEEQGQVDVEANIEKAHGEPGLEDALTAFDHHFSDADEVNGGLQPGIDGIYSQFCQNSDAC